MRNRANSAEEYRSWARRLRCRYHRDPALKLASLRALSNSHDRARHVHAGAERSATRLSSPKSAPDPQRDFATRITCELTASRILRYSRRLALLQRAQRLGIDRFDANLMIAAAQHRALPESIVPQTSATLGALLPISIFAIVQSTIVIAAWLVFVR